MAAWTLPTRFVEWMSRMVKPLDRQSRRYWLPLMIGYEMGHGTDIFGNPVSIGDQILNTIGFGLLIAASVVPRMIEAAQALARFAISSKAAKTAGRLDDVAALRGMGKFRKQSRYSRQAESVLAKSTGNFVREGNDVFDAAIRELRILDNPNCFLAGTPVAVRDGLLLNGDATDGAEVPSNVASLNGRFSPANRWLVLGAN